MNRTLPWLFLALMLCSCAHVAEHHPPAGQRPLSTRASAGFHYLLYEQFAREGRLNLARESLRTAIELDPSPQLYLELASLFWQMNDPETARTVLGEGIAMFPERVQLHRTLATSYLAEGRFREAAAILRTYFMSHPESADVAKELAALSIHAQDYSTAKDVLEVIPQSEYDPDLFLLKAQALAGLGHRKKAIALLDKTLEMDADNIEALVELAYLYELESDYPAAEAAYQRIMDLGEGSPEVWLRLIRLSLKLNNPDRAMELTIAAPGSLDFLLEAGYAFLQERFYAQAQAVFHLVEEREGSPPTVFYFYRSLLAFEWEKDFEKALVYMRSIPDHDPLYRQSLAFQGHILLQLNKSGRAAEMVETGKSLFPNEPSFWLLDIAILEQQKLYEPALLKVEEALVHFPTNKELLYRQGIIMELSGRREEALVIMERLITQDPTHSDALNFVGYTLAEEGRDLNRALILVRTALQNDPDNGYIVDSLAWVHFQRGELELAWKEIQRATALIDYDPILWEHYGDIARSIGETENARSAYERALSLDPKDPQAIRKKLDGL
jgi:tetratricopeptide (TPR) repeat protein